MTKILVAWSTGKDSALALHALRKDDLDVAGLLTTVTDETARIAMHDVREALLDAQAEALGLPLTKVPLSPGAANEEYEQAMRRALEDWADRGVTHVAFGDLFLEDIRAWREDKMKGTGLDALFPLWGTNTSELADRFVREGFRAVVTCVDTTRADRSLVGREMDAAFFAELPDDVDPCGENGEFHSFCYDGPVFRHPVSWGRGDFSLRDDRFYSLDLLPD